MTWRTTIAGMVMVIGISAVPTAQAQTGSLDALQVLSTIPVQSEYPFGYSRDLFPHWLDIDGDGCNAREQVLKRDSVTLPQVDPINCYVVAGDWVSPYDGRTVRDRTQVDIDHVVALKEAWDSGAWAWSAAQRIAFANDTSDRRSLVAASASSNRSKSDKDPSNWLPTRSSYVCAYLGNWVAVKARWGLSMDRSEHGRIRNVLTSRCVGLQIASWRSVSGLPSSGVTTPNTAPVITPSTTPTSTGSSSGSTVVPTVSAGTVFPGAWCKPEGALGVSAKGVQYVCSTTSLEGRAYSDGRARWRRTS